MIQLIPRCGRNLELDWLWYSVCTQHSEMSFTNLPPLTKLASPPNDLPFQSRTPFIESSVLRFRVVHRSDIHNSPKTQMLRIFLNIMEIYASLQQVLSCGALHFLWAEDDSYHWPTVSVNALVRLQLWWLAALLSLHRRKICPFPAPSRNA
jgi:hypothetical protein